MYNGLSFWQTLFIFVVTFVGVLLGLEIGLIPPDFFQTIEKSFIDHNRSFERRPAVEKI